MNLAGQASEEPGGNTPEGFSRRKLVFRNTLWLTAASFAGRFISYGTLIILARYFTEREVGVWAILLTAYLYAEIISNLGLDKIVVRDIAQQPESGDDLLSAAVMVKLAASAISGLIAYFCVYYGYPEISSAYPVSLALFFLAVPCIAVTRTLEAWHTAHERMQMPAQAQFLERLLLFSLLVIFGLTGASFGFFVAASALAPLSRCLYCLRGLRGRLSLRRPRNLRPLLRESLVLFAVEAIVGIYLRIDIIFVSKLGSLEEAGLYNMAYRVFEFFTVLFAGYLLAIFPSLARRAHLGAFKNTFLAGLLAVSLAAAGGIAFRGFILGLFGPAYLAAAGAFIMLMLALPLSYLTSFLTNYLIAVGRTALLLRLGAAVVISNIIFNCIFIPLWSITGAGFSFLLSEIISCLLLYRLKREKNPSGPPPRRV